MIAARAHRESDAGDNRMYRSWLSIEELGEYMIALGSSNETEVADALGDRLYVILGDCVTMDIPIHEVFQEIHKSNMTKNSKNKSDPRYRENFVAPDIVSALQKGRQNGKSL
jgi:predicted HAD superfamily Cof-like phosphohydrolase